MQDIEKVENVVNAKEIRDQLLKALNLGPGELATALGINYQRIYDLGSGRTKKFNPGMVNLITSKFPQVNPTFLYSGKGEVLLPGYGNTSTGGSVETAEIMSMSRKLIELMEQLNIKDAHLREREQQLDRRAEELDRREAEVTKREKSLQNSEV